MKPHKHAELIKAWADGATIQYRYRRHDEWADDGSPNWDDDEYEYRIKPEPKPDLGRFYTVSESGNIFGVRISDTPNLKIVFDGETGKPKSAEVLK